MTPCRKNARMQTNEHLVATAQNNARSFIIKTPKHQKSYANNIQSFTSDQSHAAYKYKGKEIAQTNPHLHLSSSEEEHDPELSSERQIYAKKLWLSLQNNSRNATNYQQQPQSRGPVVQQWVWGCSVLGYSALTARNLVIIQGMQKAKRNNLNLASNTEERLMTRVGSTYSYMAKGFKRFPNATQELTAEPLEQEHYNTDHMCLTNDLQQHFEQSEIIS
ncbi:hypothetical protein Tco_0351932 [Tanacetum coccineum]|uniref:Uncharacterized protein n=1 Tax=Tanacetum coccineum TaxID=301880 RepID=A0ABQ4Z5N7_9ASTR